MVYSRDRALSPNTALGSARCLEELGQEVVVADPNFAAVYGTRTRWIKTDRRDVAALAEANRTGIFRPAYRVSAAQRAIRQRLLVRDQLVRTRTQLINVLRSQVRAHGRRMPTGAAETFGKRFAALDLPAPVREALRPLTQLDTSMSRQLCTSAYSRAARRAPSKLPANSQFFRPIATPRS